MRAARRLCLSVFVFCISFSAALSQQESKTSSTGQSSASAPQTPAENGQTLPEENTEPAGGVTELPAGLEPNPPKPEQLKQDHLTWRGEYEVDKLNRPVRDADDKAVPVLYTKKGKRVRPKGVKVPKTHPAAIVAGTLVVDGWASKAQLHYDIQDLRYLYVSVPTVGTIIISPTQFPGSEEQPEAFQEKLLKIKANDHEIQLVTEKPILGKSTQPAWIRIDTQFLADRKQPVLGYGYTLKSPYEWPGAVSMESSVGTNAPPVPVSMRPKMAVPVCIAQPGKPCPAKPESTSAAGTEQQPAPAQR